jgi:hypothetical protein
MVASRANAVTQVDQWASFARALLGELFSDAISIVPTIANFGITALPYQGA